MGQKGEGQVTKLKGIRVVDGVGFVRVLGVGVGE